MYNFWKILCILTEWKLTLVFTRLARASFTARSYCTSTSDTKLGGIWPNWSSSYKESCQLHVIYELVYWIMICFTTTILTLRVYGALLTWTANQITVVSGVDEQPMTGTRKKAERTKSKRRKVHPKPKYLQCLSKGSISVELIGHAWPILRTIAK